MDKEYSIVNIILILFLLCYIYLSIVSLPYLRRKEYIKNELEPYNDKLKDKNKFINFSFTLFKIINVINIICIFSLLFSIYYLNKARFYEYGGKTYISDFFTTIGIYYAPLNIMINFILFMLITIAIILYFRCNKSCFKYYIKVIFRLSILDFALITLLCLLSFF